MSTYILSNYLSRSQVREFIAYILDNGTANIAEASESTNFDDPVEKRIGAALFSVREFHVDRHDNTSKLAQLGCELAQGATKPEPPENTKVVGIFYMSKNKDYSGGVDSYSDRSISGDVGDVVWFPIEELDSLELGEVVDGVNHRLFVFWGVA